MVAWFQSQHVDKDTWINSVENSPFVGTGVGTELEVKQESGFGATGEVRFLQGTTADKIFFKDPSPGGEKIANEVYTICSISRWTTDDHNNRVLAGDTKNSYFGHYNGGKFGGFYVAGSKSEQNSDFENDSKRKNWLCQCGSTGEQGQPSKVYWFLADAYPADWISILFKIGQIIRVLQIQTSLMISV
jgi:hypothetical protein